MSSFSPITQNFRNSPHFAAIQRNSPRFPWSHLGGRCAYPPEIEGLSILILSFRYKRVSVVLTMSSFSPITQNFRNSPHFAAIQRNSPRFPWSHLDRSSVVYGKSV